jgi:carboxyl-terminal processing protease
MNKAMLLAALVTPLVSASGPTRAPSDCPFDCAAQSDPAVQLYAQALSLIGAQAVFVGGDRVRIAGETLGAYLSAQDPYSGFLTRDEYSAYLATRDGHYAGVGASLERRHDGATFFYPDAQGPAARAGIQSGGQLLAIDGQRVKGKPLAVLAALVTGKAGTQVLLRIADARGAVREVSVTREMLNVPPTSEYSVGGARVLRLTDFTAATPSDVKGVLSRWDRSMPIIIDLRDCGGGDFYAAIDAAMLFLVSGMPIVSVIRRDGTQAYASTTAGLALTQPVFLWQSAHTASAAELFIGALTENGRAISVGRTSAGKGSRQDILPLANGSALVLTTGYLVTPHGLRFDGQGLDPQRPVADGAATAIYLQASVATE